MAELVLTGGFDNQEVTLANTESWSSADIAAMLSEISGKPIPFLNSTREEYVAHLESLGFPNAFAEFGADWAEAKKAGEFEATDPTLSKLLGRAPVSLKEFLTFVYGSKPETESYIGTR